MRKQIVFKVNKEIVLTETRDLFVSQIEELKNIIAQECDCTVDEIEVETIDETKELSEIDSSVDGLIYWTALYPKVLTGIELLIDLGSDEYLDAMNEVGLTEFADKYLILK